MNFILLLRLVSHCIIIDCLCLYSFCHQVLLLGFHHRLKLFIALKLPPFHQSLPFYLGFLFLISFTFGILIQYSHHLIVVSIALFSLFWFNKVIIDDPDELSVSLVKQYWSSLGHIGFIKKEPISMRTFKVNEIAIKEGLASFKVALCVHFLFNVVSCVDYVIVYLAQDKIRTVIF